MLSPLASTVLLPERYPALSLLGVPPEASHWDLSPLCSCLLPHMPRPVVIYRMGTSSLLIADSSEADKSGWLSSSSS